ncbi:MAG: hypothetical protein EOO20_22505 [Chryseobacterium sp.]|nr:MAG: hypothetical protein EOO20_22505 [Chryseobacterium sp.]
MNNNPNNPFNVTKAVDLSNKQINEYWVDIAGDRGFMQIIKPTSPMPMLILGSKGSGKTHVMKYFSFELQKLRSVGEIKHMISSDGYIGIYMRCGGLNAGRFSGKGQNDEAWITVFSYYMDLWLALKVLNIFLMFKIEAIWV